MPGSYQPKIIREQGGTVQRVKDGGQFIIDGGGVVEFANGAKSKVGVVVETTANTLRNSGVSVVAATTGAGAQIFNIADPESGVQKIIDCTVANSTDTCTVKASTAVTFAANETKNLLRFIAKGTAHLVGISATRWAVVSMPSTDVAFMSATS